MPITVSIVEDNHRTRTGLIALLGKQRGIRCLAAYPTAEKALERIPDEKPDLVLIDINLPGMSGIECVARLKQKLPDLPLVMLTTYMDANLIFNALRAGASGYLLKNRPGEELLRGIEQAHAGGAPMSMQIARKMVDHFYQPKETQESKGVVVGLSAREQEVLALLAKGCLYKEICDGLNLSMSTVRTHVMHIYEKLHVHSRAEAAASYFGQR